jgi:hypothetical protein
MRGVVVALLVVVAQGAVNQHPVRWASEYVLGDIDHRLAKYTLDDVDHSAMSPAELDAFTKSFTAGYRAAMEVSSHFACGNP